MRALAELAIRQDNSSMKFIIALTVLLLLSAGQSRSEHLPIDAFVKHGDYLELTISPDGRHLAARVRQDESVYLVIIRREDNRIIGGAKPGENSEVHSVTWVNNERVVFEYAEKQVGRDAPIPTGELYGINVDGSGKKLLYGFRAGDARLGTRISRRDDAFASQEILSVLPDDKDHILIIEYPWSVVGTFWYDNRSKPSIISRLNVYSGKKEKIETLPYNGAKAIASLDGQVNFISWESEDSLFHAAYRENGKGEWRPLDVPFSDYAPLPVAVNAAATKAYFVIPYGERRINTLYELELASGEFKQLFDGLEADLNRWVTDAESLEPVIGVSELDKSRYHYVNSESSRMVSVHKMLTRAFAGKDIFIASRTLDGKQIVVNIQSDTDPGEFHILDTESNRAEFVWANRSWIDPKKMRPMQHLEFEADDGITYYGYLTLPEVVEGSPNPPLLVIVHGGPHGTRDYWGYDSEVQLFANRGYAVLQVNYRGSGGYGEVFEEMGYHEWGGKMIDDIVAATRQVANAGNVDGNRICIYGGSYGGYAALTAAVRAPTLYRCTIGYAGIYDLSLMYEEGDIPDSWGGIGYLERVLGRDEERLAEFSPANHVNELDAAVMLIHGTQDRRAPVEHAKVMRRELEKAGKDVTWQLYEFSGHGVYSVEDHRQMYEGILKFLGTHIGRHEP